MENYTFVVNYSWNDKTQSPCPDYYFKKNNGIKTYYDIYFNELSQDDIDNTYLIKPYSMEIFTKDDKHFDTIMSTIKKINDYDMVVDNQQGSGKQQGGAKQNIDAINKSIEKKEAEKDEADKEISSGLHAKSQKILSKYQITLRQTKSSKLNEELNSLYEDKKALTEMVPYSWGEYKADKLIMHDYYKNIKVIEVSFSNQFMASTLSLIYSRVNKYIPQETDYWELSGEEIITKMLEMLNTDNIEVHKKICKFAPECFDNEGYYGKPILYDIISEYIRGGKNVLLQAAYLFGKRVFCLNEYCYRFAMDGASSATVKQRQECSECTKCRKDGIVNQAGYDITAEYSDETPDIFEITIKKTNVREILPRKYCSNNINVLDFSKNQLSGVKRIKTITYFDAITKVEKELFIDRNGKQERFFCPIKYADYAQLPSDIYETDHINGNHFDNNEVNLQRLCKICHAVKTALAHDKASMGLASIFNVIFGRLENNPNEFEKYIDERVESFLKMRKEHHKYIETKKEEAILLAKQKAKEEEEKAKIIKKPKVEVKPIKKKKPAPTTKTSD